MRTGRLAGTPGLLTTTTDLSSSEPWSATAITCGAQRPQDGKGTTRTLRRHTATSTPEACLEHLMLLASGVRSLRRSVSLSGPPWDIGGYPWGPHCAALSG